MYPVSHQLSPPPMTNHARIRAQQRAIPTAVRDALIDFGERRPDGKGAESVYFTKKSWKRLEAYMGSEIIKAFQRYRNCYLIQANDGYVVTEAHIS
jgi:hypothetical protein